MTTPSKAARLASYPNEATPLGTPRPKLVRIKDPKLKFPVPAFVPSRAYAGVEPVYVEDNLQKSVDSRIAPGVGSPQSPIQATQKEKDTMTLTLKGYNKRRTEAIYVGARTAIRIRLGSFADGVALQTIEVSGVLGQKEAKPKLTKEQRAALPKPTLAEKARIAQARADRLAKLAAAEMQPAL